MSSLSAKDRVSLCSFTFSDGRRCRTPRTRNNPRFCAYHAQKEARAQAAETLGKDLSYFFSGNYLSACDLSTALARLIPAVVRGDVKPKTAHTVAYLMQTLLQAIHLSKHEYINAFDTDGWRKAIRNSVNHNLDYRFPPAPKPKQPESPQPQPQPQPAQPPVNCPSSLATHHSPLPQAPQPAPSPHTPLPPTSAEFVQRVVASLQTGQAPQPASAPPSPPAPQPAATPNPSAKATSPQPVEIPPSCHSERSEESAFSSSPTPSPTSAQAPQTPASPSPLKPSAATTDKSQPIPATQPGPSAARLEPRPTAGPQTGPSGLPVLAPLPPRNPGAPSSSRSS